MGMCEGEARAADDPRSHPLDEVLDTFDRVASNLARLDRTLAALNAEGGVELDAQGADLIRAWSNITSPSPAPRFLWTSVWEHEEFHKEVSR
jgi:hypothetical protein